MAPFTCFVGLFPLALYFLYVSKLNWGHRVAIMSGAKDNFMLAAGLSGMVLVGPGQLIMPVGALVDKGGWAWLMIVALYLLLVLFFSGFLRPRIVMYNITEEELRSLLADLAIQKGLSLRWLGDTLDLPEYGVHLCLEKSSLFHNITLLASGRQSKGTGWQQLESLLREMQTETRSNSFGGRCFLVLSVLLFVVLAMVAVLFPEAIQQGFYCSF